MHLAAPGFFPSFLPFLLSFELNEGEQPMLVMLTFGRMRLVVIWRR